MHYVAGLALVGWLTYSWWIALTLGMVCGVIALFYAEVFNGPADSKVIRCFSWLVVLLTVIMLGVANQHVSDNEDAPKVCGSVQC